MSRKNQHDPRVRYRQGTAWLGLAVAVFLGFFAAQAVPGNWHALHFLFVFPAAAVGYGGGWLWGRWHGARRYP